MNYRKLFRLVCVVFAVFVSSVTTEKTYSMNCTACAEYCKEAFNWKVAAVTGVEIISGVMGGSVREMYEDSTSLKGVQALYKMWGGVSRYLSSHKWTRWIPVPFVAFPICAIIFPQHSFLLDSLGAIPTFAIAGEVILDGIFYSFAKLGFFGKAKKRQLVFDLNASGNTDVSKWVDEVLPVGLWG